jgi:hypothetical protein
MRRTLCTIACFALVSVSAVAQSPKEPRVVNHKIYNKMPSVSTQQQQSQFPAPWYCAASAAGGPSTGAFAGCPIHALALGA